MHDTQHVRGSAAKHFRHPPEYIAREVTRDWHAEHPEWSPDEVLFAYEYLLDIYRQARAWWSQHPQASEEQLWQIYDEIVKASLRGERFIAVPGSPKQVLTPEQRRAQHDGLWNTFTPIEKAQFEFRSWHILQRIQDRRPSEVEEQAVYEDLVRKHAANPRTPHPIPSESFGD